MPGDFRCDRGDYARVPFSFGPEAAGASGARHSLRPLFSEARTFLQNLGQNHAAGSRIHIWKWQGNGDGLVCRVDRTKASYAAISGSGGLGSARPSAGTRATYSTAIKRSDTVMRSTSVVSSPASAISLAGSGAASSISSGTSGGDLIACGNTPNWPAT